jgi:hypothetical protein
METKLTVRVPSQLLENAKRYASRHNITLTKMISAYLDQIPVESDSLINAPITRQLSGSLSKTIKQDDYKKHLEEKYG